MQFNGLPGDLREFVVICVVGSIFCVTRDVDMMFTRAHCISRLQVMMVLDPEHIHESVDVVIGDCVYELHFRVEPAWE